MKISFIGSAGIPNVYGGFESFLEHCTQFMAKEDHTIWVTCDSNLYIDQRPEFGNVHRLFISVPANGFLSVLHDGLAFIRVFFRSKYIVVLGVSGGIWFPIFRILCDIFRKRLIVNVDGIESRRQKHNFLKKKCLKIFDLTVQLFAHHIIYDNQGLYEYLIPKARLKATCIGYSGDHIIRFENLKIIPSTALTICRIEPENNIELLIEGFLLSSILKYTIVGNWNHSFYGRSLKSRYSSNPRLSLQNPIYDIEKVSEFRESCEYYLHGHSVGGTNPSLVEMLFYDCKIYCFDVYFNRYTAGETVQYFRHPEELKNLLDNPPTVSTNRDLLRSKYKGVTISSMYLKCIAQS